jgi:hypothetical protein
MTNGQRNRALIIGKNRTKKAELLAAGYAESTAQKQPPSVMKAKGWNKILDKRLPDSKLLTRHNQLLDKQEYIAIGKVGEREVVPTGEIDANAVAKGLDMAYKLKSKYPKEGGVNINEAKILVLPSVLIKKYGIPSDTRNSSE